MSAIAGAAETLYRGGHALALCCDLAAQLPPSFRALAAILEGAAGLLGFWLSFQQHTVSSLQFPPLRNNSPSSRCFTVTNPKRKASPPKPLCAKQPSSPLEPHKVPLPPQSAVVRKFYSSINGKELNSLEKLLSKDCIFQDLVYSRPFKGKSISHYLKDLTRAMGKNVRFVIDGVYEGQELTAAVVWHLGDAKDHSPSVRFPSEGFLQKPEVVLHFVGMMYRVFLRPMMLPLLAYYANLWLRTEGLQATTALVAKSASRAEKTRKRCHYST
ncbi:hypothetical protein ZIOFF_028681 [Zingiber officinale]|uniref:Uncharacterized protein n=1 Tax=Zingiber officinale TaxID=94328 RepID=A0A8J5GSF2_ZINOF|nr:hypothetical protein ZIOFF_028681 [Zingiber officinale]